MATQNNKETNIYPREEKIIGEIGMIHNVKQNIIPQLQKNGKEIQNFAIFLKESRYATELQQ